MRLQKTLPFLLIILMLMAACTAQETAVPEAESAADTMTAETGQEAMDEMADDAMADDAMADDAMADDAVADEAMADDQEMTSGDAEAMANHDQNMSGDAEMAEDPEDEGMMDDAQEESMEEAGGQAKSAADLAPWQQIALTNAMTGESFSLADFSGKTVFVEPMATWCTNCRQQQFNVSEAKAQLGAEVVFVGLSLETNLSDGELANYAAGNGFDWTYAVMSEELLAQLADQFGRGITSAPSTPHFLIRPDGSFTELSTGIHSASEIIAQIEEANG